MLKGEEGCLQMGPDRGMVWSQMDRRGDEREMGGAGRRGRLAYSILGLISFPLKAPERADMD